MFGRIIIQAEGAASAKALRRKGICVYKEPQGGIVMGANWAPKAW